MNNFPKIKHLLKLGHGVTISGVPHFTAQVFIIQKLVSEITDKPIFWLSKDETEAEKIFENFNLFKNYFKVNINTHLVHPSELLFILGKISPGHIFFTPLETWEKSLPSKEEFFKRSLVLKARETLTPPALSESLVKLGYERDYIAQSPGSFSLKGGILDIFPPLSLNPKRIEFSEKGIAQIYSLDFKNKRIKNKLSELKIFPLKLKECVWGAKLSDYLSGAFLVYADYEEFEEIFPSWNQIYNKLKGFPSLVFETLGGNSQDISLPYETPNFYHGHLENFVNDLKRWQKENWQIFIFSQKSEELKKYLKQKGIKKNVNFFPLTTENFGGFQDLNEKKIFLSDLEIYGQSFTDSNQKEKNDPLDISELKVGDYVVHLDHGIAQFSGMSREKVSGVEKEYFTLNYAEGDKLLVPVETAEKISKYFGSPHPKLHRLSGGNWYQITKKIKEETLQTAKELLKLYARREVAKAKPLSWGILEEKELANTFEYEETPDQLKSLKEIMNSLEQEKPMDRLVCGDVGFGKTELAIRAAFKAVMNQKQVAVLSPTTILTQQHFDTFRRRLKNFPVKIEILSRFRTSSEQKEILKGLALGEIDIVIGTHRLLSPDVKFKDLGLVIIDEEQRFGVKDKEKLKTMRSEAHILTLTATPIPRTLHLALSELKDISTIQTPPPGRLSIKTYIEPHNPDRVKEAIKKEIARDGQVYYLHNKVETIFAQKRNLENLFSPKKKPTFGIVHGQLPEKEIVKVMSQFDNKKIDVLVASTIIENGLDLPNVNTLIVNDASHFGLAQLYQLRGRIGRGLRQAFAYFFYTEKKLPREAKKRFLALKEAYALGSGLKIALRDLEIRGVGNILGQEQHGNIAAIGLNLYLKLLNQAVEELKTGKPQKPIRNITIDLPLESYIPKDFITQEATRLKLYQELANINSLKELEDFKKKISKNKKIPPAFSNLFEVLGIKILAQKTSITSFQTISFPGNDGGKKKKIVLKFVPQPSPESFSKLLKINPAWALARDQIKIDFDQLKNPWVEELKKTIKIFSSD